MKKLSKNQGGFSAVEAVLLLVIVVAIGGVGWYVYHARQASDNVLNAASTTSTGDGPHFTKNQSSSATTASGTDNASLQTSLNQATNSSNQTSQDMSSANSSLNDQSTLTSVPQ